MARIPSPVSVALTVVKTKTRLGSRDEDLSSPSRYVSFSYTNAVLLCVHISVYVVKDLVPDLTMLQAVQVH
jgi:hypothetical protein